MSDSQPSDVLPGYAARLDALHQALVDDFRGIVGELPLVGGETILDVGCGDGFFTGLLAERVGEGEVIGLDRSAAYLRAAAARLEGWIVKRRCRLVEGDAGDLPLDDGSVDVGWSAHSMQSYPDLAGVLREFRRVVRPGGLLAVLETDNIHATVLSWPPHVELAVRQAEHREIGSEDSYVGTYFPRFAAGLLREAGFEQVERRYVLLERQRPAGEALERYLELYLQSVLEQTGERLADEVRGRLRELGRAESPRFLPRQENFFFGSLQVLITARAVGGG